MIQGGAGIRPTPTTVSRSVVGTTRRALLARCRTRGYVCGPRSPNMPKTAKTIAKKPVKKTAAKKAAGKKTPAKRAAKR